jgi:hypothetical protein
MLVVVIIVCNSASIHYPKNVPLLCKLCCFDRLSFLEIGDVGVLHLFGSCCNTSSTCVASTHEEY